MSAVHSIAEEKIISCRSDEEKTVNEGGDEGYAIGEELPSLLLRPCPISERIIVPESFGEVKSEGGSPAFSRGTPRLTPPLTAGTTVNRSSVPPNPADLFQQPPFPVRRRLRIYPARNHTSKWVTREIAALDFLTGVRMKNEPAIRARSGGMSADTSELAFPGCAEGTSRWSKDQHGEGTSTGDGNTFGDNRTSGGDGGKSSRNGAVSQGDDDSDSDGGWLDQPLPSTAGGDTSSGRFRATPTGRNSGAGGRMSGAESPAPARRLRGREAAHIRVPSSFRHRMHSFPGHSAAVVRQWEQGLTQQERLLEGRMFFSCSKGYPIMVSSVIHYKPQEEEARRVRQKWIDERGAEAFLIPKRDWRGNSYAHLLRPLHGGGGGTTGSGEADGMAVGGVTGGGGNLEHSDGEGGGGGSVGGDGGGGRSVGEGTEAPYKVGFLDDPALKLGKHRHMTRGDQNTGPVVSSVLLFVKPRVLKDELNTQFREKHPSLPPSLTLSKIRSLKRQALLGCFRADMEVSTVALACVYFERLCLAGVVTKPNRRLAMAACLAIAYKFNEPVLEGLSKLPALWAFVDQEWQVSEKRVLEAEFGVLVQLSFNLHEGPRDIFYHFVLLLKMVELNPTLYLGEEMMELHQKSRETFSPDGSNSDGTGIGGGGGDSPGGASLPDRGTACSDARPNAMSKEGSGPVGTPGWPQGTPSSRTSWLAGWRGTAANNSGQLSSQAGYPRMNTPARQGSGNISDKLVRLGKLSKEAKQRRQALGKNVRSGASFVVRGVSSSRRRSRRRMES